MEHDPAAFATETSRRGWQDMGHPVSPQAAELLVRADAGGRNRSRARCWTGAVPELADSLGLRVAVCHCPPGPSKWNNLAQRMFCPIPNTWRGSPRLSRSVIVHWIGHPTPKTGLRSTAALDTHASATGLQVTDEQLAAVQITRDKFHGEWHYTLSPRQ